MPAPRQVYREEPAWLYRQRLGECRLCSCRGRIVLWLASTVPIVLPSMLQARRTDHDDIFFRGPELLSARISGFKLLSSGNRATRSITCAPLSAGSARLAHSLNFSANSVQLIGFSGWP